MSTTDPRREHPSTYTVQDLSSGEELNRLQIHDQVLTTCMGGVLPEQPDPARFRRVLDVGCGGTAPLGGGQFELLSHSLDSMGASPYP